MQKLVLGIVDRACGVITDDMTVSFFQKMVEKYEEKKSIKVGKNIALEGNTHEKIKADLEEIAEGFIDEVAKKDIAYTEEELRKKFDLMYDEYIGYGIFRGTDFEGKEELWKRFVIFTTKYLEKYNETLTFGEKRLIELSRETNQKIDALAKNGLDKKSFMEIAEKQGDLLSRLCENINIPMIDLELAKGVVIRDYESKYTLYGNTLDFDKSMNGDTRFYDETKAYVLSFGIKNIGRTNIKEIRMINIRIDLEKEIFDDNPECGSYVLPFTEHEEECSCKINILPNGEQMIHIIVRDKMKALTDEEIVEDFLNNEEWSSFYEYDRLFMTFDVCLVGEKEKQSYTCFACLSKIGANNKDVNGVYQIDYSGVCVG